MGWRNDLITYGNVLAFAFRTAMAHPGISDTGTSLKNDDLARRHVRMVAASFRFLTASSTRRQDETQGKSQTNGNAQHLQQKQAEEEEEEEEENTSITWKKEKYQRNEIVITNWSDVRL